MLRVLWRTGIRVNELLNIKPRDIEAQNSIVNIVKAKGGKQRRVHLDAETVKMLSEYVSAQQLPNDRPIFALTNGRCATSSSAMVPSSIKTSIRIPSDTHMRSTVCDTAGTSGDCSCLLVCGKWCHSKHSNY